MSEIKPLLFNENLETLQGSEIGIQKKLRERHELWSSVPAVATMHNHGSSLSLNNYILCININNLHLTFVAKER